MLDRLDERRVRGGSFVFSAVAGEAQASTIPRLAQALARDPGFTDARLAADEHDPALPHEHAIEDTGQFRRVGGPPDQRGPFRDRSSRRLWQQKSRPVRAPPGACPNHIQGGAQLAEGLEPLCRRLRQDSLQHRPQSDEAVGVSWSGRGRVPQDRRHRLGGIGSQKRVGASHDFVQQHTEREQVRSGVERPTDHLFGGHVGGCADARANAGQGRRRLVPVCAPRRSRGDLLGQAEVHDLHMPLGRQHHVGGLQIAVDDRPPMRFLEGLGQLVRDLDRLADRQQALARAGLQRLALHVLHRDERPPVGLADLVHLANVRMVQGRSRSRFAAETLACVGVLLVGGVEHLNGHAPPQSGIVRHENLAHAARTEGGEDLVRAEAGTTSYRHATSTRLASGERRSIVG
jgi:hypothetical protein